MTRNLGTTVLTGAAVGLVAAVVLLTGVLRDEQTDSSSEKLPELLGMSAGLEAKTFSSLDAISADADLVISGRVDRVEPGRVYGRPGIDQVMNATVWVRPIQVIKGRLPDELSEGVAVEIFVGRAESYQLLADHIRELEGLWFLTDEEQEARRLGIADSIAAKDHGYYKLVNSQGLVANANGVAINVMAEPGSNALYQATTDRPFAEVLASVRAAMNP